MVVGKLLGLGLGQKLLVCNCSSKQSLRSYGAATQCILQLQTSTVVSDLTLVRPITTLVTAAGTLDA